MSIGDHGRLVIGLAAAAVIHGLLALFIASIPPRPVVEPKAKKVDRYAKGVNAGLDQFGGVEDTAELVAAVKAGKIAPARIDDAAGEEQLQRLRRTDQLPQQLGGAAVRPEADPREDDAEARRVRGDPQIGGQGEAAADSHGIPVDAPEHGLGELTQA